MNDIQPQKYSMLFSCDLVWDSVPSCFPIGQDSHENNILCLLYNIVQIV